MPAPGSQLTRDLRRLAATYRAERGGAMQAGTGPTGPELLSRRQMLVRGAQVGGAGLLAGGAACAAFEAMNRDYAAVVVRDCVDSMYGQDLHESSLENVARCFGWVVTVDEVIGKLAPVAGGVAV